MSIRHHSIVEFYFIFLKLSLNNNKLAIYKNPQKATFKSKCLCSLRLIQQTGEICRAEYAYSIIVLAHI